MRKRFTLLLMCKTALNSISEPILASTPILHSHPHLSLSSPLHSADATADPAPIYSHVLLGMKKRGFGVNKWNGYGGKIEPDDSSIDAAAIREMKEECNIRYDIVLSSSAVWQNHLLTVIGLLSDSITSLSKRGILLQEFENDPVLLEIHVYIAKYEEGMRLIQLSCHGMVAQETEEMRPQWYTLSSIPYSSMWPDDIVWYPFLFANRAFRAHFLFRGNDRIVASQIEECTKLEQLHEHYPTPSYSPPS